MPSKPRPKFLRLHWLILLITLIFLGRVPDPHCPRHRNPPIESWQKGCSIFLAIAEPSDFSYQVVDDDAIWQGDIILGKASATSAA